ncbi:ABC transporter ATP-binding protein [bacterium]|nr:ABC transporter ATP-binding protein [bacterium]
MSNKSEVRPAVKPAGLDNDALLEVEALYVSFANEDGDRFQVLEDVSFKVPRGQTIGLVGESGCGKSVSAMSIMGLLPSPPSYVDSGRILFDGVDLLTLDDNGRRKIRGDRIGMIFQEPMTSLNPTFSVDFQLSEVFRIHRGMTKAQAFEKGVDLLRMIGVSAPEIRMSQYPHQLSGGLRQRIMIAMALACRPDLLIADEPTTALDVTIQAQILDLLTKLQEELGMSILMITHDLGVVAEFCSDVYVMYAGRIVEHAPVKALFEMPAHPYTRGLLASIPRLDEKKEWLPAIPGMVPPPDQRNDGCYFADRCERAMDVCRKEAPALETVAPDHQTACWYPFS